MKRTLPFFTAALLTSTICAQNWTVGVPAAFKFSAVMTWGGGCYPGSDQNIVLGGPDVFGMQYYAIVDSVTPAGTNTISPGGLTPLNAGDTVQLSNGGMNSCLFPTGSGTMYLSLWMIGTPTTAGQVHPCVYNDLWMSNLMICPEGLSTSISGTCTVQPGTVGLTDNPDIAQQLQFPSPANGNTLRILDPAVRSVEVFNACGSRMASITSGSLVCDWSEGVYFVRVSSSEGVRSERMVVRRW
jgi:hypothetical protein